MDYYCWGLVLLKQLKALGNLNMMKSSLRIWLNLLCGLEDVENNLNVQKYYSG